MSLLLPEPGALALVLALGIWTALDQSACLQVMLAQPVVACWLAGWIAGDPQSGLAMGLMLQGVWSRELPMGASPLPFLGPAAVTGGALVALAPGARWALGPALTVPDALPLALALAVSIAIAETGKPLLQQIYRHRGFVRRLGERGAEDARPPLVRVAHLLGMIPIALLGCGLVAIGLLAGGYVMPMSGGAPADGRWVALPVLGIGIGHASSLPAFRRVWTWPLIAVAVSLAAILS